MRVGNLFFSGNTAPTIQEDNFITWAEETGIRDRQPRVLLTSVFGPYAQDDEFGSRKINPMELFQNQVTRAQGAFSIRMFHSSWGIKMIQANVTAPSTVLDFPTRETFEKELTSYHYDIVGISSIIVNVGKVREMCMMVRRLSPHSKIVVGGHVAAVPQLEKIIDADHIVHGEGISWMRRYLDEDPSAPIHHPIFDSSFGRRYFGILAPDFFIKTAIILPSVGCPMGCNFCCTSSFFGGKGKFVNFFKTGKELFDVMCEAESKLKTTEFFIQDENFLLHRQRALELLELMKKNSKVWSLYLFSSANALRQYTMDELLDLGVTWVWLGLESPRSRYAKLEHADTRKLVSDLQDNGISVLGSTIIGLEHHNNDNIMGEIRYAISHCTDLHQFMLYTPFYGTPLSKQMEMEGRLLEDIDIADTHGQYKFNFKHGSISRDDSKRLLDLAFQMDFEQNGPSMYRIVRTGYKGWRRNRDHPNLRVRKHLDVLLSQKATTAFLWAMENALRKKNPRISNDMRELRLLMEKDFGLISYLSARILGPIILWFYHREEKRLAHGVTYEPRTFIERKNWH